MAGEGTAMVPVTISRVIISREALRAGFAPLEGAVLTNGAIVDARPSDAVNLAAITGAPVLVAAGLLDLPTGPDHATTT